MNKRRIQSYDRTPRRGVRFSGDAVTSLRVMLQDAGFSPIPVMGKKPVIEDWPNKLDVSREEIFSWEIEFPDVNNTGILTQNTPTFDCDILSPVAAAAVEKLLRERFGKTGRILKRTGMAPKFAIPFRTDTAFAKIQVKLLPASAGDDADPEKLEFLGDGQQFVAFGIHPDTGQPYTWGKGSMGAPDKVWRKYLPPITAKEAQAFIDAAARTLIEHQGYRIWKGTKGKKEETAEKAETSWGNIQGHIDWAKPVGNIVEGTALHDSIRDLAASMIGSGVSPPATIGLLRAVMQASTTKHDARWRDRYNDIDRTVESAVTKYAPPLQEHLTDKLFDPWVPFVAPGFPLDVLPSTVQQFVTAQAEVLGCDVASMAMTTIGAFSGALDHRFSLKMMRHGNWYARPRLWLLLCGDPSKKKTPLIDAATWPLEQYQNDLQSEYKLALSLAGDDKDAKPDPPLRLVVWDTTIEKLGELLARGDRGLLVKRDEFSGWIGQMEKYGGGRKGASADRAFWLKSISTNWNRTRAD